MRLDILIPILVMAAVTYALRFLPLMFLRNPIRNPFVHSFLTYVPYVTLALLIFPAVVNATGSIYSGWASLIISVVLAWKGVAMPIVGTIAWFTVIVIEMILI